MRRSLAAAVLTLALAPAAHAQWQPTRPIRMVVGFAPGGTADIMARIPRAKVELIASAVIVYRSP